MNLLYQCIIMFSGMIVGLVVWFMVSQLRNLRSAGLVGFLCFCVIWIPCLGISNRFKEVNPEYEQALRNQALDRKMYYSKEQMIKAYEKRDYKTSEYWSKKYDDAHTERFLTNPQ